MERSMPSGLCLILDQDFSLGSRPDRSLEGIAEAAMAGGVKFIQYRAKNLSKRDAYRHSLALRSLTRRSGATLLINDFVDLALAVEADGVHLGRGDLPLSVARGILGPSRIIGISAHTLEQAREAERDGADYLGVGPIFTSTTKQVRSPLGCERLRQIRREVRIPVIAIGGITESNAARVMRNGVAGVAVVAAILSKADVTQATAVMMAAIESGREGL